MPERRRAQAGRRAREEEREEAEGAAPEGGEGEEEEEEGARLPEEGSDGLEDGGPGLSRLRWSPAARETPDGRRIRQLLEKHASAPDPAPRRRRAGPRVKFELIEHTADVGVRAYGATLSQAFENAALGMFSIVTEPEEVSPVQDFDLELGAEDLRDLLHEWLSRLLALSQVNGVLFSSFRVELGARPGGGVELRGVASGEPADPSRHAYKTEIKAVTRHMLEVREDPPSVRVLFDI